MHYLYSIQEISKVYETGDVPVLVLCDNMEEYVCKHARGNKPCEGLFAEYLAYNILKALELPLPEAAFVAVKQEHIEATIKSQLRIQIQPVFFKEVICFATLKIEDAVEFVDFPINSKLLRKILNPKDLVKIAWFDMWFANEDRNLNNFNLLLKPTSDGLFIVPIDHAASFNSLMFSPQRTLIELDANSSIIYTDQFKEIVKPCFKNLGDFDEYIKSFYLCIPNLKEVFDKSINEIPESWAISEEYLQHLKTNLFSEDWLKKVRHEVLYFIKNSLNIH